MNGAGQGSPYDCFGGGRWWGKETAWGGVGGEKEIPVGERNVKVLQGQQGQWWCSYMRAGRACSGEGNHHMQTRARRRRAFTTSKGGGKCHPPLHERRM
jgi:hypothetical protein